MTHVQENRRIYGTDQITHAFRQLFCVLGHVKASMEQAIKVKKRKFIHRVDVGQISNDKIQNAAIDSLTRNTRADSFDSLCVSSRLKLNAFVYFFFFIFVSF